MPSPTKVNHREDGNDKRLGVDIGSMTTHLSLANGRNADEGNRNIIRNPPIQSELEQGDLRKTMIILYEMLRILGLQVMDSNLDRAGFQSAGTDRKREKVDANRGGQEQL